MVAKSSRAYRSAKRSKELLRQKKQEEKRLRRLARHRTKPEGEAKEGAESEVAVEGTEEQEKEEVP